MVRGQSGTAVDAAAPGRQWLTAQFQAAGAVVDFVVVYQRRVPHFSAEQLKRMQDSRHDGSVWLFSSAEGLEAPAARKRRASAARNAGAAAATASS
jgi:uroporphyrinogen-III synthase